jgi:hypothetical protein
MQHKLTRGHSLLLILLTELIAICLIASVRFINWQSTIILCLFNFLFASLTFYLNGNKHQKLGLLTIGNIIGLSWNFVFFHFCEVGTLLFGVTFDAAYRMLYPFLNLMWIVPFWSVGLSLLPKATTGELQLAS